MISWALMLDEGSAAGLSPFINFNHMFLPSQTRPFIRANPREQAVSEETWQDWDAYIPRPQVWRTTETFFLAFKSSELETLNTGSKYLQRLWVWTDRSRRDHRGCPRRLPVWSSTQTSVWPHWCWPRSGCLVSSASTYSSYCLWSQSNNTEDLIIDNLWGCLVNTVNIHWCVSFRPNKCVELSSFFIKHQYWIFLVCVLVEHKIQTKQLSSLQNITPQHH